MDVDILGLERRRRWSEERRREIVLSSFAPGVLVKDVARRHDVSTSLVFAWRRQARQAALQAGELFGSGLAGARRGTEAPVSFLPVHLSAVDAGAIASPEAAALSAPASCANPVIATAPEYSQPLPGCMEITLGHGRTVRVDASVDADALRRIIVMLDGCR